MCFLAKPLVFYPELIYSKGNNFDKQQFGVHLLPAMQCTQCILDDHFSSGLNFLILIKVSRVNINNTFKCVFLLK